jgi:hypothetical protein
LRKGFEKVERKDTDNKKQKSKKLQNRKQRNKQQVTEIRVNGSKVKIALLHRTKIIIDRASCSKR